MKKIVTFILAGLMVVSLAACAQNQTTETATEKISTEEISTEEISTEESMEGNLTEGGFTAADNPVVPEELYALFDKATEKQTGAEYTPVAYLASQVVAGTNYLVLCKVSTVTEEAKTTYALVTLYEDPEGNAEIIDVRDSEAEAGAPDLDGGWEEPETPEITKEAMEALEKATEPENANDYIPEALVATQVVSGTNYCVLCDKEPVPENGEAVYQLVYIYEDLEGNAEITAVADFAESDN